mgnify:CR=1 FL=1
MPRLQPDGAVIHPDCEITDCEFGAWTEVGRGSRLAHVAMGDYSYCDRVCDLANAEIGRFANIASFVRVGATDHPLDRASLHHFLYRSASYWEDAGDDDDWFARRRARVARIGHDTWIGHNAQVKPEVRVGHGAVVAAGAVVTRDVAPYTDDRAGVVGLGPCAAARGAGGFPGSDGGGVSRPPRAEIGRPRGPPSAC